MNPELEALIRTYDAVTLANNEQAPAAWSQFETLLEAVLIGNPRLQRESLVPAVQHAHRQWQRSQRKTTTLPPGA
jgi:hypothetical protein